MITDEDIEAFLAHHGVKGMKWGIRKDRGHEGQRVKTKKLEKLDKKFEKQAYSTTTWISIHNRAAELATTLDVGRINNKSEYKNVTFDANFSTPLGQKYLKEHQDAFLKRVNQAAGEIVGTSNPSGNKKVGIIIDKNNNWGISVSDRSVKTGDSIDAVLKPVKHSSLMHEDFTLNVKVTRDSKGHITKLEIVDSLAQDNLMIDDFLEHFGVKGMRWGVRKDRPGGVSKQVDREARKDAEEHARARAYYGVGAGTRRKLINESVEAKSKRVPGYKQAFDFHTQNQDMSKHVSKAISERKRTDFKVRNKQRGGAIARRVTGEMGTQAAMVALVAGGAAFLQSPRGKTMMAKTINTLRNAPNIVSQKRGADKIADFLKKGL